MKLNITARAFSTDEISDKDADASFIEEYRYLPVKYDNNAEKVETEKKLSRKEYKLLVVEDNSELLSTYAEMFSGTCIQSYRLRTVKKDIKLLKGTSGYHYQRCHDARNEWF